MLLICYEPINLYNEPKSLLDIINNSNTEGNKIIKSLRKLHKKTIEKYSGKFTKKYSKKPRENQKDYYIFSPKSMKKLNYYMGFIERNARSYSHEYPEFFKEEVDFNNSYVALTDNGKPQRKESSFYLWGLIIILSIIGAYVYISTRCEEELKKYLLLPLVVFLCLQVFSVFSFLGSEEYYQFTNMAFEFLHSIPQNVKLYPCVIFHEKTLFFPKFKKYSLTTMSFINLFITIFLFSIFPGIISWFNSKISWFKNKNINKNNKFNYGDGLSFKFSISNINTDIILIISVFLIVFWICASVLNSLFGGIVDDCERLFEDLHDSSYDL